MKNEIIALQWIKMACHYEVLLNNIEAFKQTNKNVHDQQIEHMHKFKKLIFETIELLDEESKSFLKTTYLNKDENFIRYESRASFYRKRKKALINLYRLIHPSFEMFDKI